MMPWRSRSERSRRSISATSGCPTIADACSAVIAQPQRAISS
jgi:hypothetical protein